MLFLQFGMTEESDTENEELAIRRRVKAAMREYQARRGWPGWKMAEFLRITENNYEAYAGNNSRGIPLAVIARFCEYAEYDISLLLYGKHARRTG